MNHNLCRNPDNDPQGPWCYHESSSAWSYCDVQKCDEAMDKNIYKHFQIELTSASMNLIFESQGRGVIHLVYVKKLSRFFLIR